MPLSFNSKSHGNIAFGFFNIETDMLLLEDLFFFANHFCHKIIDLAEQSNNSSNSVILEGFCINDRIKIGNLHNAIQGVNFTGFIGETYSKFPFPSNPEGFKQKNCGIKNQDIIKNLIYNFGEEYSIEIKWDSKSENISIDKYTFNKISFSELIMYVNDGGYPRWENETRPSYVKKMIDKITEYSPLWYIKF